MNAILSGRSGRALIIEGNSLRSFDVNDPSNVVPRQQADLPYLFGEAADLRVLENTTLESVERELRNDCNFTWALDLTLISLDPELAADVRKMAVDGLNELFSCQNTLEQVESVLYAEPLPKPADPIGVLDLCELVGGATVQGFFQRLEKFQPMISNISHAWESIPTKIFGSYDNRDEFRSVAVKKGLFRALVIDTPVSMSGFYLARFDPSLQKLSDVEHVLSKWYELAHANRCEGREVNAHVDPRLGSLKGKFATRFHSSEEPAMGDLEITCSECCAPFTFTAREQEYYRERNLTYPKRCKPCRDARRANFGAQAGQRQRFHITCDQCGKRGSVPFRPLTGRPVLCSDCVSVSRAQNRT